MYCAPGITGDIENSCYSYDKLVKIAKLYNKTYNDKINYNKIKDSKKLWQMIRLKLSDHCNNEVCWVRQPFIANSDEKDLKDGTFRPTKPSNKKSWLSTSNIAAVMGQYEKVYKDFKFIGPVPIDFIEVLPTLVLLPFDELYKKGIRKYGIVYNTDPSYKPGEHWISMFIRLDDSADGPSISFFDSYGLCPPPEEVLKYINYVKSFENKLQKYFKNPYKIKINCNDIRHQFKNSECGVYSMHFITESLKNKTFKEISNNIIKDDEMKKARKIYFSPE